jgi:uncharacterized protein (DUF1778 family)
VPEKKSKIGRPKLPKGHARGEMIQFRAQPGEREMFEKAAKRDKASTLSDWIRETLRKAAI